MKHLIGERIETWDGRKLIYAGPAGNAIKVINERGKMEVLFDSEVKERNPLHG